MEPTVVLCSINTKDICLPLSPHFSSFSGQESLDVVYQDQAYNYRLEGLAFMRPIKNIRLLINNRDLQIEFNVVIEKEITKVYLYPRNRNEEKPFFLLYGVTEITVYVQYDDGAEQIFFSSYLAIAVRQDYGYNIESVKDMLDDIYKKDHALLHKGKVQNKVASSNMFRFSEDKISQEITLLGTIFTSLKQLLPYFLMNPHTIAFPEWTIDSFEKLHTVQSKNLNYITTHPEQLRTAQGSSGIFVRKQRMIPERTLVSVSRFSCDISENRAIVSFIQTLLLHLQYRKVELSKLLLNVKSIHLKEDVSEKYIISASVIQEYTRLTLSEHLSEIENLLTQCSSMLQQYAKALPCAYSILHQIPAPTHCFMEIHHYRRIYEIINRWFTTGDYTLPSNSLFLHFASADSIYEYFCLLNLYDIFVSMGFSEQTKLRNNFKYICNDPRYVQCDTDNTFYFSKDDCELTLYYQPIIYSEDCVTRNGITLFRTDGKCRTPRREWYYSPDFVIKKQTATEITYAILDAKWRPQNVLLDCERSGGLSDLSYKYLYSIADENTLCSISFFWLLQGKDNGQGIYRHNNSSISKKKNHFFQNSTGIVRLSPKFGNEELTNILHMFLSN